MKNLLVTVLTMLICLRCLSQTASPITSGTIVFEKTVNEYALIDQIYKNAPQARELESYRQNNPQFQTYNFKLSFNLDSTSYIAIEPINKVGLLSQLTAANQSYSNLKTRKYRARRKSFGTTYYMFGVLPNIRWKLTKETRDIAGFKCTKAEAKLNDSIPVVAFFTQDIIPNGGPELFNGLPGMILGVALPNDHITWFAKEISKEKIEPARIVIPETKKELSIKEVNDELNTSMLRFGQVKTFFIRNIFY